MSQSFLCSSWRSSDRACFSGRSWLWARGDDSNEPAAGNRTGRVARALQDGKLCHYVIFDNKTATAIEDRIGRCNEHKPKPKKEKPATFSWGK